MTRTGAAVRNFGSGFVFVCQKAVHERTVCQDANAVVQAALQNVVLDRPPKKVVRQLVRDGRLDGANVVEISEPEIADTADENSQL